MNQEPILMVEDDFDIQENLRFLLESEGFSVESVFNAQEALDYLKAGKPTRLILLDLMMPILNGYEFLNALRQPEYQAFKKIPILILSAATDVEKTATEHQVGFVRKPIDLDLFLNSIQKIISS